MKIDPRNIQIFSLICFLCLGVFVLNWQDIHPSILIATILTGLTFQFVGKKISKAPIPYDAYKSALISSLSLILLLRSTYPWLLPIACGFAIASKFLFRAHGRHLFNPTNIAIVVAILFWPKIFWVSPGQWGQWTLVLVVAIIGGFLVTGASARISTSLFFLAAYSMLIFGRAFYLGDPMTIPWLKLQSGSLMIFTFFMISDPRTTPNHIWGRAIFVSLVAALGFYIQTFYFKSTGILFALAIVSLVRPIIDFALPDVNFTWRKIPMKLNWKITSLFLVTLTCLHGTEAIAFCGFYVAKADSKLYNKASQVVVAHDGERNVITMSNDYQGDLKEFAIVIPVPSVLTKEQIHIGEKAVVEHLDAYSSPRLVEYFDPDPCQQIEYENKAARMDMAAPMAQVSKGAARAKSLGVTIEAQYTVGEYDILILSAKQSGGLLTWLVESGYKLPDGAEPVLKSYVAQNMKFFVAKVNLKEQAKTGFSSLRPIQMAFESKKFMLPVRLGTVNSNGVQDLLIYMLSKNGRVETTNYRTIRLPSDKEVPLYIRDNFGPFYKAMFDETVKREGRSNVFMEYAWDMGWCDPCAADPLTPKELKGLGAMWMEDADTNSNQALTKGRGQWFPVPAPQSSAPVFITRLHVQYDKKSLPEDLIFQETGDKSNFQGRYILNHPYEGSFSECSKEATANYKKSVADRQEKEIANLASLTGWPTKEIRSKMKLPLKDPKVEEEEKNKNAKWYQKLWSAK